MRKTATLLLILNAAMVMAQHPVHAPAVSGAKVKFVPDAAAKTLVIPVDTFALIYPMIPMVDTVQVEQTISYLEGLGDRNCLGSNITTAQNWINNKFQTIGLTTSLQPVEVWGNPAGANVLATQTGTVSPNEYVVVGGHYDSYSFSGGAPGADDDASGTAGVIEIARILKNYNFERTIIYCAFTGEEYGLYGSDTCVAIFDNAGMNIVGYFNLDMIGYSDPDSVMHTDIICPLSAMPLSDFFIAVKNIFVPSLPAHNATLSGGDSDHTSFNNHGYMGIFPFENVNAYSPDIHSDQDLIGNSVNNFRFVRKMVQSNLASVATLARPVGPVGVEGAVSIPFEVFPNPASDRVSVYAPVNETMFCKVYSSLGEEVFSTTGKGTFEIEVSQWAKGIYYIRLFNESYSATQKLIRQ